MENEKMDNLEKIDNIVDEDPIKINQIQVLIQSQIQVLIQSQIQILIQIHTLKLIRIVQHQNLQKNLD